MILIFLWNKDSLSLLPRRPCTTFFAMTFFLSVGPFSPFLLLVKGKCIQRTKECRSSLVGFGQKGMRFVCQLCALLWTAVENVNKWTHTHRSSFAWRMQSISGQSLPPPLWHVVALLRSHPQSQLRIFRMPVWRVRNVWMRVSFSFYIEMIFVSSFGIHLTEFNIHFGINRWTDEHALVHRQCSKIVCINKASECRKRQQMNFVWGHWVRSGLNGEKTNVKGNAFSTFHLFVFV